MREIATKAILAVLAGVFGVGTAATQGDGGSGFTDTLREIAVSFVQQRPPELQQQISEFLLNSGLL
jgi:hypothetical protein